MLLLLVFQGGVVSNVQNNSRLSGEKSCTIVNFKQYPS